MPDDNNSPEAYGPPYPNFSPTLNRQAHNYWLKPHQVLSIRVSPGWSTRNRGSDWRNLSFRSIRLWIGFCSLFLLICAILQLIVSTESGPTPSRSSRKSTFASGDKAKWSDPGVFPVYVKNTTATELCLVCDCRAEPPFFAPSFGMNEVFSSLTDTQNSPSFSSFNMNKYLRRAILDMYCAQQHLQEPQGEQLLFRSAIAPESIMSWFVPDLKLQKPTIYLTTATSPNGKAAKFRPQYIRRHSRAIHKWIAQSKATKEQNDWQVLWILVEDEAEIDWRIVQTLRKTGLSYIYIAYGSTRSWGNAQKNAALQLVHALTRRDTPTQRPVLGHGPVYGLDDDNKIQPGLLEVLTKVVRVGVFPVGNLGGSGWESPIVDEERKGVVTGSDSAWGERKFPFDYGAYTFNSSLLGTVIPGPSFWDHREFAGEDVFLERIVASLEGLELLCDQKEGENCHLVWHNEELSKIEKMTDEEQEEYVDRMGPEALSRVVDPVT